MTMDFKIQPAMYDPGKTGNYKIFKYLIVKSQHTVK